MAEPIKRSDETDAGKRFDSIGDVSFIVSDALPLVTDGFVTKSGWRAKTYLTHGLWPMLKIMIGYVIERWDKITNIIKRHITNIGEKRFDEITDDIKRYDEEVN